MTKIYKIINNALLAFLGSFLCGVLLFLVGATVAANVNFFPDFWHNLAGYESGGVFGALVGLFLGGLLPHIISKNWDLLKWNLLANIIIFVLSIKIYDYYLPYWGLILILLLPTFSALSVSILSKKIN